MGDSGDYWRGRDEYKRRQRDKMVECLCGSMQFPGECNRCGRKVDDPAARSADGGEKGEGEDGDGED